METEAEAFLVLKSLGKVKAEGVWKTETCTYSSY